MPKVVGVILEGCECGDHILTTFLMDDGTAVERSFSWEEALTPHPSEMAALN